MLFYLDNTLGLYGLETPFCMVQVGKLSTGDSLDMSSQDEASIVANDATIKDMEVMFYFWNLNTVVG